MVVPSACLWLLREAATTILAQLTASCKPGVAGASAAQIAVEVFSKDCEK
jgi:hypothetical protein